MRPKRKFHFDIEERFQDENLPCYKSSEYHTQDSTQKQPIRYTKCNYGFNPEIVD
jgi:hypothetical protein